jgi:hypothetical protein
MLTVARGRMPGVANLSNLDGIYGAKNRIMSATATIAPMQAA